MHVTIRNSFEKLNSSNQVSDVRIFIDVFRASTTCLTLLETGVKNLIIANDLDIIKSYHKKGYSVISEVFNLGLDNSPTLVNRSNQIGENALLKTSNLTTTIARNSHDQVMLIACFRNMQSIVDFIKANNFKSVEIIPAGLIESKKENIEDSHCAEVLQDSLVNTGPDKQKVDFVALETKIAKKLESQLRPQYYIDDLWYSIEINTSNVIPSVQRINSNVFNVTAI